jgi:hypothetical protein
MLPHDASSNFYVNPVLVPGKVGPKPLGGEVIDLLDQTKK